MTRPPRPTRAFAPSGYDGMGEFHDLFMDTAHERLQPALGAAFGHLGAHDVVFDIGAGTGLGVRQLGRLTRARIVALEPSLTMRAVMLARIADDPVLAGRVRVFAGAAPAVFEEVPGEIAGFVCAHMLGHLTATDRAAMFTALGERLTPQGVGVVTVNSEVAVATEPVAEERWLGEHRYVARHYPATPDRAAGTEYEVYGADGRRLRAARFAAHWNAVTAASLIAELPPHEWTVTPHDHASNALLMRRQSPTTPTPR